MAEIVSDQNFIERLKILINAAGSAEKLAHDTGVLARNISKYLSGSDPSRKRLIKLAEGANVNLLWLATGEGPQKKEAIKMLGEFYRDAEGVQFMHGFTPEFYMSGMSSYKESPIEPEQNVKHLAFSTLWLRDIMKIKPEYSLIISAMGDSMSPTICDGDQLLVDKSQCDVRDDAIYVLRMDKILHAKRLQRLYDGSIQIKNDNNAYDTQHVPHDHVGRLEIIGRVIWVGGRI